MSKFVSVDGVRYEFGDDARFAAIVDAMKTEPARAVLRGCRRCEVVCAAMRFSDELLNCSCCLNYGKNFGGGTTYYPSDGKGHRDLMTRDEFFARLERLAA